MAVANEIKVRVRSVVDPLLGETIRDRRSGLVGKVVGVVEWLDSSPSVIVQPPARDGTVPATVYVPVASIEPAPANEIGYRSPEQRKEG